MGCCCKNTYWKGSKRTDEYGKPVVSLPSDVLPRNGAKHIVTLHLDRLRHPIFLAIISTLHDLVEINDHFKAIALVLQPHIKKKGRLIVYYSYSSFLHADQLPFVPAMRAPLHINQDDRLNPQIFKAIHIREILILFELQVNVTVAKIG